MASEMQIYSNCNFVQSLNIKKDSLNEKIYRFHIMHSNFEQEIHDRLHAYAVRLRPSRLIANVCTGTFDWWDHFWQPLDLPIQTSCGATDLLVGVQQARTGFEGPICQMTLREGPVKVNLANFFKQKWGHWGAQPMGPPVPMAHPHIAASIAQWQRVRLQSEKSQVQFISGGSQKFGACCVTVYGELHNKDPIVKGIGTRQQSIIWGMGRSK